MSDVLTILGPTASGKTTLAAHLAVQLHGEILSADSRQVYRDMNLGTGKDYDDYIVAGQDVPIHLIDIVEAGSEYNLYSYQQDFQVAIGEVRGRGALPILCGGTGLYLEAVLTGYRLLPVPPDPILREQLEDKSMENLEAILAGMKRLHNVTEIDTRKRVIRAIEIETYNKSHPDKDHGFPPLDSLILGIQMDRDLLKRRITARLQERISQGLIEEVEQLMASGVTAEKLLYYGLEYRFVTLYLQGELTRQEMFDKLNIAIHQFSKRQRTWFRRMEKKGLQIHWLDGSLPLTALCEEALCHWNQDQLGPP